MLDDLHNHFSTFMDFCSKYCFDLVSFTCYTAAMLVLIIKCQSYGSSEEAILAQYPCATAWMLAMLISLIILQKPKVQNRKFKTCRQAIIHWIMLSTVAPLVVPLIIAIYHHVLLTFLYVTLLTLYLTIRRIPAVIQRFEDSQHDHRTDDQNHSQDN